MGKVANLLFPADYFDRKAPDGAMRVEYEAATAEGRLDVSLFDLELFEQRGVVSLARPFLDPALPLVYRGWMMRPGEYDIFFGGLRRLGLRPLVSPEVYSELHMFPLAYARHEVLRDASPKLISFPGTEVDAGVVNRAFDRFMVKDYVKSVKGTPFPSCIETPVGQAELDSLVAEFVRLRGGLFTEGIALKEVANLRLRGETTNEWRAFYLRGRLLNVCRNSNQHGSVPKPPENFVASCENLGSPYYTVDFAELEDGGWIVLETGDGQVSGLATAQDYAIYYQVLADRMGEGA